MSQQPHDPEFAQDAQAVGDAYRRAMRTDERLDPPAALDDAIRAAARRAVGAGPRPAAKGWVRRHTPQLAAAAVVVLSVSVVMVGIEERPDLVRISPAGAPPSAADAQAPQQMQPALEATESTPPLETKVKEEAAEKKIAAPMSAPAPRKAERSRPAIVPEVQSSAAFAPPAPPAPPGEPAPSTLADAVAGRGSVAKSLASEKNRDTSDVARDDTAKATTGNAAPPVTTQAAAASETAAAAVLGLGKQTQAASAAKPVPPPTSAPATAATAPPPAPAPTIVSPAASRTVVAAPATPAISAREELRQEAVADDRPGPWIERMLELRRQAKWKELREELARFRKRHPDVTLPHALTHLPAD